MGRDHLHQSTSVGSAIGARVGAAAATTQCRDNLWLATDGGLYRAAVRQDTDLKFEVVAPTTAGIDMPAFADHHGRLWFGIAYELIEVVQGQIIKYGREDRVGLHAVVNFLPHSLQATIAAAAAHSGHSSG
jgi:hypothetical protein